MPKERWFGGFVATLVAVALGGLLVLGWHHLDYVHDVQVRRVEACKTVEDPALRTLCVREAR